MNTVPGATAEGGPIHWQNARACAARSCPATMYWYSPIKLNFWAFMAV